MKRFLLISFGLLPTICLASESEWIPADNYSINMKQIIRHGEKAQTWIKTDGICEDTKCEGFIQIEVLCNESKYRPIQTLAYNKATRELMNKLETPDSEFKSVAPESTGEYMIEIICKPKNKK